MTLWLWSGKEAGNALASGDLGTILKTYRRLNGLSQEKLAAVLGYDKTYISLIENHRRTVSDVKTCRHIARVLGLPPHVLGVTDGGDADFAAMLQFGDSTIRLAEIARQSGRAVDAINELWPLTARLEARAADGRVDRGALALLARARLALGVSLGTVLPEERLGTAAKWTGKALTVASRLEDDAFFLRCLQMHGNELRKAGRLNAAAARLEEAGQYEADPASLGTTLAFLARTLEELGDAHRFDQIIENYRRLLDRHVGDGMLFSPFVFNENSCQRPTHYRTRTTGGQCGLDSASQHGDHRTTVACHRAHHGGPRTGW